MNLHDCGAAILFVIYIVWNQSFKSVLSVRYLNTSVQPFSRNSETCRQNADIFLIFDYLCRQTPKTNQGSPGKYECNQPPPGDPQKLSPLKCMAKVVKSIGKCNTLGESQVLMRVTVSRSRQIRIKSGIFVPAAWWRDGGIVKPRANRELLASLCALERLIGDVEREIIRLCESMDAELVTKRMLEETAAGVTGRRIIGNREEDGGSREAEFFGAFNLYIDTADITPNTKKSFRVLARILDRYARYRRKTDTRWQLGFDSFDDTALRDFEWFIRHEAEVFKNYPDIYRDRSAATDTRVCRFTPHAKGENTKTGNLKRLRTFWRWAMRRGYVSSYLFQDFGIKAEVYGTPFYLKRGERDALAAFDFSGRPALAVQRDIFVFQCLTGCRVSDLRRMRESSVVNGAVEYIPGKTISERGDVVRVPLNDAAKDIVRKYEGWRESQNLKDPPLLPFISDQKYNKAIKEMLRIAGIDRQVTVLDSLTRREERHPIWEVASSHMARRTFIGNLYKMVKDPNLVGSLSGHKEGSRAFARYREIDEDMKRDLVDLL